MRWEEVFFQSPQNYNHTAFWICCWGQRLKTKIQPDIHKSLSQWDTLQFIMSSRLVFSRNDSARGSQAYKQQIQRLNSQRNTHRRKPFPKNERAYLKEINQAHFGTDNKFAACRMDGNLICTPHYDGKVIPLPFLLKGPKISSDK